ncbi:MAG: 4-hydroxy-tetrahydrodipicolinate synthase [Nitrospirae bacterium]|nr:4-hydroxy-tetrahydrodipicolinate synthase [Nitrospirota bacterium]
MFKGSMVAIVTPFKNGVVDEKAFGEMIEFQIASGTDGIIPCGTTGESATLTHEEHNRVIEFTVETAARRAVVLAGTGSNNTEEAVTLTRHAKKIGADGALLISPYYNKPTQEGLYRHYKKIAESVDIPIVLYNVPGRTGVNILPATVARLADVPNIVAIKEASGSMAQVCEVFRLCGDRIGILSGEDAINFPILTAGGQGMISVTANVVPKKMAEMWDTFAAGNVQRSRDIHYKLMPLHDAMFIETNPIPVKTALALMGRCSDEMRLPLCPMEEGNLEKLKKTLEQYGLLRK